MKLKLTIQEFKALFGYIQFVLQYVLAQKEKEQKASFRTIDLNCELFILSQIRQKILMKLIINPMPLQAKKKRSATFKIWEAATMLRYHKIYSDSTCRDQYINSVLDLNFSEWYQQLLK